MSVRYCSCVVFALYNYNPARFGIGPQPPARGKNRGQWPRPRARYLSGSTRVGVAMLYSYSSDRLHKHGS
eukprot:11164831-Lingulodinium_polyedra.AAC.1